jgi:hypothetical protein
MLPVQSCLKKYFASGVGQITFTTRAFCSSKGRFAIVTNAGQNAMDADALKDEGRSLRTAKSCGPDASTPASSWRKYPPMTVTRKPDHRGEPEGNR